MSIASVEAQKQLDRIVALGYPDVADMSAAAFRALAEPLIGALEHSDLGSNILLVPTRELVSPESLIARTSINRMAGFTTMPPRDIASFLPQDGFMPPEGPFYLVVDPHTGTCYINREPDVARKLIDSDERLPLTLEEGLAIATQHPEWLLEKNGFNLLGSRSADGRVPSIWMSQNAPRLGAVWPNSKHTWLGNAFCMARRGVSLFRSGRWGVLRTSTRPSEGSRISAWGACGGHPAVGIWRNMGGDARGAPVEVPSEGGVDVRSGGDPPSESQVAVEARADGTRSLRGVNRLDIRRLMIVE